MHGLKTLRNTARNRQHERNCHVRCIVGQNTGRVGDVDAALACSGNINMVDPGPIIRDQL